MATFEHYKYTFSETVRELAGGPMRSLLPEFVDKDNKKGASALLDSAGPGPDKTTSLTTGKKTRSTYEADGSKTLAKWVEIHTPHDEITQIRTFAYPYLNEWGHTFDEDEPLLEIVDPTNKKVNQGMRVIWKARDQHVINGIAAASVSRVQSTSTNEVTPETIAFPAGQEVDTDANDAVGLTDLTKVNKMFRDQYIDQRVYCLVSPATEKLIIDGNSDIHNTDFVDKSEYFMNGTLPAVYGISFICHPLIPDDKLYFFTKEAIVMNQFKPFKASISKVAEKREGTQAYMRETLDAVRVDDLQVVHMTITTV